MVVYRMYNHHPTRISHLVTICAPYTPPMPSYLPIEQIVKILPNFTYQIALCDPQTEQDLQTKDAVRSFLKGVIRLPNEKSGSKFNVPKDIVKSLGDMPPSKIMSEEVTSLD